MKQVAASSDESRPHQVPHVLRAFSGRKHQSADPSVVSERSMAEGIPEDQEDRALARIIDGYALLVNLLAADVSDIRLDSLVSAVTWQRGRVTVTGTARGEPFELTSSAAIITCPVPLLSEWGQTPKKERGQTPKKMGSDPTGGGGPIQFEPALPVAHQNALESLAMGDIVRVSLVLDEPFWRSRSIGKNKTLRSLTFVHAGHDGMPVCWTTHPIESPVLVAWFGFPESAELVRQSRDDVESATIASVARLFHTTRRNLGRRQTGTSIQIPAEARKSPYRPTASQSRRATSGRSQSGTGVVPPRSSAMTPRPIRIAMARPEPTMARMIPDMNRTATTGSTVGPPAVTGVRAAVTVAAASGRGDGTRCRSSGHRIRKDYRSAPAIAAIRWAGVGVAGSSSAGRSVGSIDRQSASAVTAS